MNVVTNSFEGKIALVTGAGRGIGRTIAMTPREERVRDRLTARSLDQLVTVQSEIQALAGKANVVQADLTRDDDLHSLVQRCGPVDFLINNAGWGKRAPVVRSRVDDWDQTFRLNLRAPMILAKEFLPAMIKKGRWRGHQHRLGVRQERRSQRRRVLSVEVRLDRLHAIPL